MGKPKKKLMIPGDYSNGTTSPHNFVKPGKTKEKARMVHTAMAVACTKCKATGTIDMPSDIDVEKLADKVLGGRVIRGFCGNCRQNVEFRPFTPDELKRDGLALLGRYLEIHDKSVVQEQGEDGKKVTSPADAIGKVLEASDEYMKQVKEKVKGKEPLIISDAPPEKEGGGSIIVP